MKKRTQKLLALMCALSVSAVSMIGCGNTAETNTNAAPTQTAETTETAEVTEAAADAAGDAAAAETVTTNADNAAPKYVFLFIGDGMSYTQTQLASYYQGSLASQGGVEADPLSFMTFPVAGSATTYDSTSFCPDSASTATSIASGNKTYSGVINMDTTLTTPFETIAEQLRDQNGYKIGVISSVNLNHATPAAFYAHQSSRKNYYEIGEELVASDYDYFAGGALLKPTGDDEDKTSIYDLAVENGYNVVFTQAEAEALTADDGKSIVIAETLADADSMSYAIDAAADEWTLADYVSKGIDLLDNETGFFMMVEGGKVDWACHANDAGSTIMDTIALSDAVDEALSFYNEHPDETLILVTGDHETGGLTIGFAGTNYDTFLANMQNQNISYAKFDSDYVTGYKENNTPFEDVLTDITANFGLMTSDDPNATEDSTLVLTDYEIEELKKAYEETLSTEEKETIDQGEYVLYGTYEPLSVTITHILNNKSGISFTSYSHTGLPVPVYAIGSGAEQFSGSYDNTDIYFKLAGLEGIQ